MDRKRTGTTEENTAHFRRDKEGSTVDHSVVERTGRMVKEEEDTVSSGCDLGRLMIDTEGKQVTNGANRRTTADGRQIGVQARFLRANKRLSPKVQCQSISWHWSSF